jgi:hypothetical protein
MAFGNVYQWDDSILGWAINIFTGAEKGTFKIFIFLVAGHAG